MKQNKPILVAHRGYPECYPENTTIGITAALELGAKAIEFDIQLTKDHVPILFHDDTLQRVTSENGCVFDLEFKELKSLGSGESQRFGNQFDSTRICSLSEMISLLEQYPQVEVFVELKEESFKNFGIELVVEKVLQVLNPIKQQCVIISFEQKSLSYVKEIMPEYKVGWILTTYDKESFVIAEKLRPEFLICNYKKIPKEISQLQPGLWSWMLYVTNDINQAKYLYEYGAEYVETDDIGNMIKTPE